MPSTDSPAIIVARYLKSNGFEDTFEAFLKEAGLPADAGAVQPGALTIEVILQEKKTFDRTVEFEKLGLEVTSAWSLPAPSVPLSLTTLPTASNILHLSHTRAGVSPPRLIATTADRRLHLFRSDASNLPLVDTLTGPHDSPVLFVCTLAGHLTTISTCMSGLVVLYDHESHVARDQVRHHTKYAVCADVLEDSAATWLATAGWDAKVFLYRLAKDAEGRYASIGAVMASISLLSNPEALLFVRHPETPDPIILLARRDSTRLHYYGVPADLCERAAAPGSLILLGSQSLTPSYSTSWAAFSPSAMALCPTDPLLLAVATSAMPYLKVVLVRLLIPTARSSSTDASPGPSDHILSNPIAPTADVQAVQAREQAAILAHVSTLAPQTAYSTPAIAWRPDGSGVWVNGEDGVIRGVEVPSGKVVASLQRGHEAGSKVRTLWAGMVAGEEWMVSGGFDQKLVVWRI